jgi:DnaK suppressor protein
MKPLSSESIVIYKGKLQEELAQLEEELSLLGKRDPQHPEDWIATPDTMDIDKADDNEVADELESLVENTSILSSLEKRYQDVKAALSRIEQGTYGICRISGKPIEKERLDANPAADTSIEHKND